MPTGYTAAVADGTITDLRTFALQCARGMGALITMRDEPWDAPIPEKLEPSTRYHDEKLATLRAELDELVNLTNAQCAERQEAERAEAAKRRAEYAQSKADQRTRYEAMIAQVEAWQTDAEGIRDFMLSQLRESVRFDCGGDYLPEVPALLEPDEWRLQRRKALTKEIGYHEGERAAEIARTAERNRWLTALRASLPEAEQVSA